MSFAQAKACDYEPAATNCGYKFIQSERGILTLKITMVSFNVKYLSL
jgi:hypothetical protein